MNQHNSMLVLAIDRETYNSRYDSGVCYLWTFQLTAQDEICMTSSERNGSSKRTKRNATCCSEGCAKFWHAARCITSLSAGLHCNYPKCGNQVGLRWRRKDLRPGFSKYRIESRKATSGLSIQRTTMLEAFLGGKQEREKCQFIGDPKKLAHTHVHWAVWENRFNRFPKKTCSSCGKRMSV